MKLILTDIRDTEDPKILNKYRKLFRTHVPIASRAYFSAYLLKYGSFLHSPASKKRTRFKKLYWGAGKSHRVTSKTIQDLLLKIDSLQKTDIGTITILHHYSFIEVNENFADTVIATFNESTLERKKRLAVSYAKKK